MKSCRSELEIWNDSCSYEVDEYELRAKYRLHSWHSMIPSITVSLVINTLFTMLNILLGICVNWGQFFFEWVFLWNFIALARIWCRYVTSHRFLSGLGNWECGTLGYELRMEMFYFETIFERKNLPHCKNQGFVSHWGNFSKLRWLIIGAEFFLALDFKIEKIIFQFIMGNINSTVD